MGVFAVVDMRDVADFVSPIAAALPIRSIATYREVLAAAAEHGVLDPRIGELAIDAIPTTGATTTLVGHCSAPPRDPGQGCPFAADGALPAAALA